MKQVLQVPEVSAEFSTFQAQAMIEHPNCCALFKVVKPLHRGAQYAVVARENTVLFEFKAPAEKFIMDVSVTSIAPFLGLRVKFSVPPASPEFPKLHSENGVVPLGTWVWEDGLTLEYIASAAPVFPYNLTLLPVGGLKSTFGDRLSSEPQKIEIEQPSLTYHFVVQSRTFGKKIFVLDSRPTILFRFSQPIASGSVLPLIRCELNRLLSLGSTIASLALVEGEEADAVWFAAQRDESVILAGRPGGLTPQTDLNWMVVRPVEALVRSNNYNISIGKIFECSLFIAKPLEVSIVRGFQSVSFEFTQPMVSNAELMHPTTEERVSAFGIAIEPSFEGKGKWLWKTPSSLVFHALPTNEFVVGVVYTATVRSGTCSMMNSELAKNEVLEFFETCSFNNPHRFLSSSHHPIVFLESDRALSHQGVLQWSQARCGAQGMSLHLAYGEEDAKSLKSSLSSCTQLPSVILSLVVEYIDLFQDALEEEGKRFEHCVPERSLAFRIVVPDADLHSEVILTISKLNFRYQFTPQPLIELLWDHITSNCVFARTTEARNHKHRSYDFTFCCWEMGMEV